VAFAVDAVLWVLNRLFSAIDRIQRSCQYQTKLNQDASMAHDLRNIAREASAAAAASFKSASRKLTHYQISGWLDPLRAACYRCRVMMAALCPLGGGPRCRGA